MSNEIFAGAGKRTLLCECTAATFAAADTVSLEFLWTGPAPRAGQFFLVKPRRTGVFLGRPISVAGWDAASGTLRFLVARRGRGSSDIADIQSGEKAYLIGPLGNYWAEVNIFAGVPPQKKPIALVGGGIGIAPLLAFAGELLAVPQKPVPFDFYAGFRSASFGLENLKTQGLDTLVIASEDGSEGQKGRVTDFLNPAQYSAIFACGPEPMFKALGGACAASGISCFVSLEKHMACGVGACRGCTIKTMNGNRRCCADGPIFNAGELCFDE